MKRAYATRTRDQWLISNYRRTGNLQARCTEVNYASGQRETVVELPGFSRGVISR